MENRIQHQLRSLSLQSDALWIVLCSVCISELSVNDVLRDFLGKCVIAYIDDILIVTSVNFTLRVSFHGYDISSNGISMDSQKTQAVTSCPQPCSVRKLQSFLGFANFYQYFIRSFIIIAAPYFPPQGPTMFLLNIHQIVRSYFLAYEGDLPRHIPYLMLSDVNKHVTSCSTCAQAKDPWNS